MSHRTLSTAIALLCCGTAHAAVRHAAGPIQQVLVASDIGGSTQYPCSTGFDNVPGAALRITIPSGPSQLLTARFSADAWTSQDNPGVASGYMRIVAGANTFLPDDPSSPFLVTTSTAFGQHPPVAFERSLVMAAGPHNVVVQYCVDSGSSDTSARFYLSYWHLTLEAAPLQ